jgi:hypothetical protein
MDLSAARTAWFISFSLDFDREPEILASVFNPGVFVRKVGGTMSQRPSAISLMICDQVIFERVTHKPYLLGVFTGLAVDGFPTGPQKLDIFAALTDGHGKVTIRLTVLNWSRTKRFIPKPWWSLFPTRCRL